MAVTEKQEEINFAVMYATHDAFRRDLDRFARAVAARTADSPGVRAGWENFKHQLHVHHTVEDDALWPRVLRAVANRPRDLALMAEMEAEHAALDPRLAAVDDALARGSADLGERLADLTTVLTDHMRHEEDSALPLIQEVLTVKDWDAFRGGMSKMQGPSGAAVYVPWITDGIADAGRRRFFGAMPAPLAVVSRVFWESRYRRRNLWGA